MLKDRITTKILDGKIHMVIEFDEGLNINKDGSFRYRNFHIPEGEFKSDDRKVMFEIGVFSDGYIRINDDFFPLKIIGPIEEDKVQTLFRMIEVRKYYINIWSKYRSIFGNDVFERLDYDHFAYFYKIFTNENLSKKAFNKVIEDTFGKKYDTTTEWNKIYNEALNNVKKSPIMRVGFNNIRAGFITELIKNINILMKNESVELFFQDEIERAIQVIWPNYIKVIRNKHLKGFMNEIFSDNEVDFMCLDINGNIDLIEIKDSKNYKILNSQYRKSVHPLSSKIIGPISQLVHLSHKITKISNSKKKELSKLFGVSIDFINFETPKGILIMGKDQKMSQSQKMSFREQISQYKSLAHFYTYDDILKILNNILKLKNN